MANDPTERFVLVASLVCVAFLGILTQSAVQADDVGCPWPGCPMLRVGPAIEAEISPETKTINPPHCINPINSDGWEAWVWASYCQVGYSCSDNDEGSTPYWVRVWDPFQNAYVCDHIEYKPWKLIDGGPIEVTWEFVGNRPDLTKLGTYYLKAIFSNPVDTQKPSGCERWESDEPVERIFTLIVSGDYCEAECGGWTLMNDDIETGQVLILPEVLEYNVVWCSPSCENANFAEGNITPVGIFMSTIAGSQDGDDPPMDVEHGRTEVRTDKEGSWKKTWKWYNTAKNEIWAECPAEDRTFNYEVTFQGQGRIKGVADTYTFWDAGAATSSIDVVGTVTLEGDQVDHQVEPPELSLNATGNAWESGSNGFTMTFGMTGIAVQIPLSGNLDSYDSGQQSGTRMLAGSARGGGRPRRSPAS